MAGSELSGVALVQRRGSPIGGGGRPQDETWAAEGYGYGWFAGTAGGRRAYFHPGDNPGYLAFNAWLPDDDIRLAVLANEETTDLDRLLGELLHLALSG